ncbi:glycine-rich domain-containing protein [Streptomyces sp. NPDC001741]|uniref:glycine-rich domain-containing protein n=1 Tax=Streptomyces sp. NPDC001741 TaxID=3364605 RepID=UPI00369B6818
MTIALERPVGTTDPAALVDPEVMERLAVRVTKDHPDIELPIAHRIIGQTAAFLAASAALPGAELSPSKAVDVGWHTWILHTVDYAAFCERVAGRFIHHVPTPDGESIEGGPEAARQRTLDAISAAGFRIDHDLWPDAAMMGECSQCHAGCTDSPNGGKKQ